MPKGQTIFLRLTNLGRGWKKTYGHTNHLVNQLETIPDF